MRLVCKKYAWHSIIFLEIFPEYMMVLYCSSTIPVLIPIYFNLVGSILSIFPSASITPRTIDALIFHFRLSSLARFWYVSTFSTSLVLNFAILENCEIWSYTVCLFLSSVITFGFLTSLVRSDLWRNPARSSRLFVYCRNDYNYQCCYCCSLLRLFELYLLLFEHVSSKVCWHCFSVKYISYIEIYSSSLYVNSYFMCKTTDIISIPLFRFS